jgi:hypothetical protein
LGQTPILRPLQPNGRVTTVPRTAGSAIGKPRWCNRLVHLVLALLGLSATLSTLLVTWNERSRSITAPLLLGRCAAAGALATDGRAIVCHPGDSGLDPPAQGFRQRASRHTYSLNRPNF